MPIDLLRNLMTDEPTQETKEPDSRIVKVLPYIPKHLHDSALKFTSRELDTKPFNKFKHSFLPFRFKMNVWGGWITPDANWYLETITHDKDLEIKRRLQRRDPFKDPRIQAFKEGWVRVDYRQPIFDGKFSTIRTQEKFLSFTLEPKTLKNQKMFWAIEQIATIYDIAITDPLYFEINKVKYVNEDNYKIEKRKFNNLSFFVLDLQTIKYRGN